jgi:pre-mRNA-splicing factor 38A
MRALAAIYIRMTFSAAEVYELLEPLMKDYRKLRYRDMGALIRSFFVDIRLTAQ